MRREELVARQLALGVERPPPWIAEGGEVVGACFVCFERGASGPGSRGDSGWAAAFAPPHEAVVEGRAEAEYEAGLLWLREGPLLERALRALPALPDALLVNGTGRDHPRRAGVAVDLGERLGLPTVGVTHRPLLAAGEWPADEHGARSPLVLEDELVGYWLRTRSGTRPLAVHAAWRTDPETAAELTLGQTGRTRTAEPLRQARRLARTARAG